MRWHDRVDVRWKRLGWGYGLALPLLLWLGGGVFWPTLRGIYDGFTDLHLLRGDQVRWVGLANYARLWQDPLFWRALGHSFALTGLAVPLELGLGLLLALGLRRPLRGLGLIRALLLVGWVSSTVAQVMAFQWTFAPGQGPLAQLLRALGREGWMRNWFADPQTAFGMVVLLHVWRNAPFFGVGLFTALLSAPRELYEAACLDGASAWQQFRAVTVPHLRWMATALVLGHVVFTFTDYTLVAVSTGGGPLGASEVLPTYLYRQAWTDLTLGQAAATGTVMFAWLALLAGLAVWHQGRRA